MGRNVGRYWIALGVFALWACGPRVPVDPASSPPRRDVRDPLAVGWALKAAVSEARGDAAAAERAHGWVRRLDRGPWATLHEADFARRQGRAGDAREGYAAVLGSGDPDLDDPVVVHAMLGLGLLAEGSAEADAWLGPVVDRIPCRTLEAPVSDPLRATAQAQCLAR